MTERDDESRPLRGRVVVVTRPREQALALIEPLELLGADVLVAPTIEIVPMPFGDELRAVVRDLGGYDLLIFTSANAVRHFADRVAESLGSAAVTAALGGAMVAAVGPRTAEVLSERGLPCDIVPADFIAEGLIVALDDVELDLDGAHVLIPRAVEARDVLPDALRQRGARVDIVAVYETRPAEPLAVPAARLAQADFITFTSGSTVYQFVALMKAAGVEVGGAGATGAIGASATGATTNTTSATTNTTSATVGARFVSIGPQTSEALVGHGLAVAAEADPHTGEGLVCAIVALAGER